MEEVYVVRYRHSVEKVPIRQLAREMGIQRNTIRRYLLLPSIVHGDRGLKLRTI